MNRISLVGVAPVFVAALLSAASAQQISTQSPSTLSEAVLYSFQGGSDGENPYSALVIDAAGNLYGTTQRGGNISWQAGTVFRVSPNGSGGWNETVLHVFQNKRDGDSPVSTLALDAHGNLYGTAGQGGPGGVGTVFQMTPSGNGKYAFRTLYSFTNGTDGAFPYSGVILDKAGNLYGTTSGAGAYSFGTVFKLTRQPGGSFAFGVLHAFAGPPADGYSPYGLAFDASGNLYGTTAAGGVYNSGTIFELFRGTGWSESILYSFTGGTDGGTPAAAPAFGPDDNLYGTTQLGGDITTCGVESYGCGTVYELKHTSSGWIETALYSFQGGTDGDYPVSQIAFNTFGNLYGTTDEGGSSNCANGCGTVFEMIREGSSWDYRQLYQFQGGPSDGTGSAAGLALDSSNNLFGTSQIGGANNFGTVFEIVP